MKHTETEQWDLGYPDIETFLDGFRGIIPERGLLSVEERENAILEMKRKGHGIFVEYGLE